MRYKQITQDMYMKIKTRCLTQGCVYYVAGLDWHLRSKCIYCGDAPKQFNGFGGGYKRMIDFLHYNPSGLKITKSKVKLSSPK